jgi:hypothetical protein
MMMMTFARHPAAWVIAATLLVGTMGDAAAQGPARPATQVISANPFGIMLEFFNAEYERTAGESFSVGLGGSIFTSDDDTYRNLDAFWRFYPDESPTPLEGWSFGLKAGVTTLEDKTYLGAGFDVNRSWLLGANDNFYVGAGIGLKRLIGHGDELRIIPTIRLVNIGYAF